MGFNFSSNGPPRFKNDKKKEVEAERQIVDKTQNLREVINEEKATEARVEKRQRGGGGERRWGGGGPPQQEEEKKQYKIREKKDRRPRKNDEYGVEEVSY